jgi:hypothetical protein
VVFWFMYILGNLVGFFVVLGFELGHLVVSILQAATHCWEMKHETSFCFFFFFLVGLRFELRALHLQSRCSQSRCSSA